MWRAHLRGRVVVNLDSEQGELSCFQKALFNATPHLKRLKTTQILPGASVAIPVLQSSF